MFFELSVHFVGIVPRTRAYILIIIPNPALHTKEAKHDPVCWSPDGSAINWIKVHFWKGVQM